MGTQIIRVGKIGVELVNDDRICASIRSGKPFEPTTLDRWAGACEEGGSVLDVGAYSGLFSIAAAKLGAKPIAIEPMPVLVERIKKNAALNKVKFEILNAAAGPKNGTARLGYNDKVKLTSGASILRKSGGHHIVRLLKLDSIRLENLAAIKIDVERYEAEVLRGAMHLIEDHKPILFIEVLDPEARSAVEKLLPRYRTLGLFDNRNLIMEPRS